MKLSFSFGGLDPAQQIERQTRAFAQAVTAAMAGAAEGVKTDLRRQLVAGGSRRMQRLSTAIRVEVFPRPPRYSPKAAATVYAKGADAERYFAAFTTGAYITARRGSALAIPLHNFRGVDGRLLGPRSSFFSGRLKFIPAKQRGGTDVGVLAIPATGTASQRRRQRNTAGRRAISKTIDGDLVPVFILVRAVRLPKLLSPAETVEKWGRQIPGLIQQALRVE